MGERRWKRLKRGAECTEVTRLTSRVPLTEPAYLYWDSKAWSVQGSIAPGDVVVLYIHDNAPLGTQVYWARAERGFEDGRFVEMPTPQIEEAAQLLRDLRNAALASSPSVLGEEKIARRIAAEKMGLYNDGEELPDDLWQQALPLARKLIAGEEKDAEYFKRQLLRCSEDNVALSRLLAELEARISEAQKIIDETNIFGDDERLSRIERALAPPQDRSPEMIAAESRDRWVDGDTPSAAIASRAPVSEKPERGGGIGVDWWAESVKQKRKNDTIRAEVERLKEWNDKLALCASQRRAQVERLKKALEGSGEAWRQQVLRKLASLKNESGSCSWNDALECAATDIYVMPFLAAMDKKDAQG